MNMLRWWPRLVAVALGAGLLGSPIVQASNTQDDPSLAAVRNATARFHSLEQAGKAQYASFLPCFDQPGVGGMGQHYVKGEIVDTTLNATEPEALVYEVDGSQLRFVAVEYLVPIDKWTSAAPPVLFGRPFFRNDTLGVYFLHAWIWRDNPLGTFSNYNPAVKLCPG